MKATNFSQLESIRWKSRWRKLYWMVDETRLRQCRMLLKYVEREETNSKCEKAKYFDKTMTAL